jgi:hypothetical protein
MRRPPFSTGRQAEEEESLAIRKKHEEEINGFK